MCNCNNNMFRFAEKNICAEVFHYLMWDLHKNHASFLLWREVFICLKDLKNNWESHGKLFFKFFLLNTEHYGKMIKQRSSDKL